MLCIVVFPGVFAVSAFTKFTSLMGLGGSGFTLQGEAPKTSIYNGEIIRQTIQIPYITNEGDVETRPIILYKPADVSGDLPLIYVPHYAIEEDSANFQEYMVHGWAAASPTEFKNDYNGQLVTDDLVFNNAALYTLRNMDGIDRKRIAIVGGSAGGYMSMMLNELQMGNCAAIANSPIVNVYYNFAVHFLNCDEVNRNAGASDFPIPIQGMVSKLFRPINDCFDGADDPRWAALSPIGMARCVSNPVVINHFTGDILVPVDQITKRYTYPESDGSLPDDFPVRMGSNYPGILSRSFEEEADPEGLVLQKFALKDHHVDMNMPFSDKLLTINILDDGPMSAKGSHTAPGTSGSMDEIPYLEEMFSRTLAGTEKAVPEKVLLLLIRYQGNSIQLPAHEGVDDAVYGSLSIYRQEVLEELAEFAKNHSLDELDTAVRSAITDAGEEGQLTDTWNEIKLSIQAKLKIA